MKSSRTGLKKSYKIRFSIAAILVATTLVALYLGQHTQEWGRDALIYITLLSIQIVALGTCIEVLARNVPSSIARLQKSNCFRQDGTWSKRRAKIEESGRTKLRIELGKACLLVALVTNIAGWFVHREVIPIPVAAEALSSFRMSETDWKDQLSDDELRLDNWLSSSAHLSPSEALTRKRMLWRGWPVALLAAFLWLAGCVAYVTSAYRHALNELRASAKFRSEQYQLRGLHESVGHDDFGKVRGSRTKSAKRQKVSAKPRGAGIEM